MKFKKFFLTCKNLKKAMKWTDATQNKNNSSNLNQLMRGHSFIKEHHYIKMRNYLNVINKNNGKIMSSLYLYERKESADSKLLR